MSYASVNGLRMYYEVHGAGDPIVLLHGSFCTIQSWGAFLPALARSRQVIAVELQGHGHTADLDRPLTFPQLGDDVAALLPAIGLDRADVYGYSMGGTVALYAASRHPARVRKLIVQGALYSPAGWEPAAYEQFKSIPADFAPPFLKDPYDRVAPDPSHWPVLVSKVKQIDIDFAGMTAQDLRAITANTLIIMGDREGYRLEHAVEMYRGIPTAQLAIIPGTDHFMVWTRPDEVSAMITRFLDEPVPAAAGQPPA